KLAEYLVLYNSKRPHKALALMTPVEYILKENKNCNMWWTHTVVKLSAILHAPNSLTELVMARSISYA
ncbi:hypothetical protein ACTTDK_23795, partial [Escherichia coli]